MMPEEPIRISLRIDLGTREQAESVSRSLAVDDDDYVVTGVDGNFVIAEVEADSIDGARRAADDWLACLMAIVKE